MTRNQLLQSDAKKYDAYPIFTVDCDGNVLPATAQTVAPEGGFLIQPLDPSANKHYPGYVCASQSGVCKCSALISNLDPGENHMRIRDTAFTVRSSAPTGHYTIGATTSDTLVVPIPNAGTGDVYIGNGG